MSVKKRIVYYLSGFDPRGVRYYQTLYKEHFQKQSKVNGIEGEISARRKITPYLYEWEIHARDGGKNVHTQYRFLAWDDIIREEWSSGMLSYYKDLLYCIGAYFINGLIMQFAKASPKQMLAGLYPIIYLIAIASAAVYAGYQLYSWIGGWIGFIIAIGIGASILSVLERIGNRIGVFWLLRIYAFSVRHGKGEIGTLDERVTYFADELVKTMQHEEADEVLLVSHSVGTILAVSVLAKALDSSASVEKFAMVTLGECIPLMSFQPNAVAYRNELLKIASYPGVLWLDYTSPIDGACFPLHDFMRSSDIQHNTIMLQFLSPRFHKLFDKIKYKQLRRDWYTTHFLYLMSTEKSGAYDYYALTAGAEHIRAKVTD